MRTLLVLVLALAACSSNVVNNNAPMADPCQAFKSSGHASHETTLPSGKLSTTGDCSASSCPLTGEGNWCCTDANLLIHECVCAEPTDAERCTATINN
jgi:hypothetical protein